MIHIQACWVSTNFPNHSACCCDSLRLKSVLRQATRVIQLTVYTCRPRPGGPGDLASPAGAAGRLPSDGPSGNAAVSVEHHDLTGSHRQLACQTAARNKVHHITEEQLVFEGTNNRQPGHRAPYLVCVALNSLILSYEASNRKMKNGFQHFKSAGWSFFSCKTVRLFKYLIVFM